MHGIIFSELASFARDRLGAEGWKSVLEDAGLGGRVYLAFETYPDAELLALVSAAASAAGASEDVILEDFGGYIVPGLLKTYGSFVLQDWRTLDVLENTEGTIHRAVRLRDPGATPPKLQAERRGPGEVAIIYTSPRKLCSVARGIIRGISEHYGERIELKETTCMKRGDAACELVVRSA